jgi:hypothetical protein
MENRAIFSDRRASQASRAYDPHCGRAYCASTRELVKRPESVSLIGETATLGKMPSGNTKFYICLEIYRRMRTVAERLVFGRTAAADRNIVTPFVLMTVPRGQLNTTAQPDGAAAVSYWIFNHSDRDGRFLLDGYGGGLIEGNQAAGRAICGLGSKTSRVRLDRRCA